MKPSRPLFALLLLSLALVAGPAATQQLTLDAIFDGLGEKSPSAIAWAPNGHELGYRWKDDEGDGLWVFDAERGESRLVVRAAALAEAEEGFSLDAYHWAPDSRRLLFESNGDLFLFDRDAGTLRRLTETEAEESDPKFSPDGNRVAFVRSYDLHLIDLGDGSERRLTEGGEKNVLLNGVTDWVYWEELWGRDSTGFWWSDDGERIAYYQFDETPVAEYSLVDFQSRYPTVEWQKYPKAGSDNPLVRVGVLELASGETTWMATGDPIEWYLPRIDWRPQGDLAIQRLDRDQNRLEVLRCAAASGDCAVWITETSGTWVDVSDDYRYLPDGRLLWPSERSGFTQLYLLDAEGEMVRRLTDVGGAVTALAGIAPGGEEIVYQAYDAPPLGALGRRLYRGSLDGSAAKPLSPVEGWASALMAPGGRFLLEQWSRASTPPQYVVRDSDYARIGALPYEPPDLDLAALPQRRFFTIQDAEGRQLPASMIQPLDFDPERRYPVVMYHYGGPESQVVADRWSSGKRELWTRMMAERGYVQFSVDNPGSSYFGHDGAALQHRRFGEVNLAAQRVAVAYLGQQSFVDSERIGLWGWSGGGANTLYCLFNAPGTWRAGVSGAPVTDWYLYDTIWTERYLDHPESNPEGYRDSSPVTRAGQLEDALLIVHGTADDNVHPQNTLVLTDRLIEAGRPFEMGIYPRQKHGFRGDAERHFYDKMTRFFERHLGGEVSAGSGPG